MFLNAIQRMLSPLILACGPQAEHSHELSTASRAASRLKYNKTLCFLCSLVYLYHVGGFSIVANLSKSLQGVSFLLLMNKYSAAHQRKQHKRKQKRRMFKEWGACQLIATEYQNFKIHIRKMFCTFQNSGRSSK